MFYEKFQVFGIHIYLENHLKLLCTPLPKDRTSTTQQPQTLSRVPHQQSVQTSHYNNPNTRQSKNENYAIEVLDQDVHSKASQLKIETYCVVTTAWTVLNLICLQIFHPR